MIAMYVYGLAPASVELPPDLRGLGPTGEVTTIQYGQLAALVGDVETDRPLGTRDDLLAHEKVVDTVATETTVLPMRFGAVVASRDAVVEELLAPHHDKFLSILSELEDRVQFTLKGRYELDTVLREVISEDTEVLELREHVQALPEDASYYDRVRLGELVVAALERRREGDAAVIHERLSPLAVATAVHQSAEPEDVVNTGFLVERKKQQEFEQAVEKLGAELVGRMRFRLLGPLAPYDFVPQE